MEIKEAVKFLTERRDNISYRLECAQRVPCRSYYERMDEALTAVLQALSAPSLGSKALTVELPQEAINARFDVADMLEDFKKEAEFSDHSVGINGITWAESALLAAIVGALNIGRQPEKGKPDAV